MLLVSQLRAVGGKMNIQKRNKELIIRHKLKRGETYKVSEGNSFKTISIFKKPIIVNGISNSTEDMTYIPFIDYDNTSKEIVLEDARRLIKEYHLSSFYLFTTKEKEGIGNYHLISLSKCSYSGIKKILSECRCDSKYITMNLRNPFKSWVLRISKKGKRENPKFLQVIKSDYLDEEISKAHLDFLNKIYKLPKIKYKNVDRGSKIKIHTYETFR